MNKKVIRTIIILSTISLVAAIITQLFWVRDALRLKEDQFNSKVEIVMQSVVNQLMTSENIYPVNQADYEFDFFLEHEQILNVVNPFMLDSLIRSVFSSIRIDDGFKFGVYRLTDSTFVMGDYTHYDSELINSSHWVSLTCLCEEESYVLSAFFPHQHSKILSEMIILPIMSGLFLMVLVFSFFFTIMFLFRQKRFSDMKTDFVNNMTHEFKTPIATISMSSEMLTKEQVINKPEKIKKYANIIFDENTRLKNQVEKVLQIAILDKGDYNLKLRELDAHEVIENCIKSFRVQVSERKGKLKLCLQAKEHEIVADKVHFANVITNILDNANKYSIGPPDITVTSENLNGHLNIHVQDKGIGINPENKDYIFKKFHRLQSGNIHDVKGFGLGLFYVKSIVEKMGGSVELKSELKKGSRFTIKIPV